MFILILNLNLTIFVTLICILLFNCTVLMVLTFVWSSTFWLIATFVFLEFLIVIKTNVYTYMCCYSSHIYCLHLPISISSGPVFTCVLLFRKNNSIYYSMQKQALYMTHVALSFKCSWYSPHCIGNMENHKFSWLLNIGPKPIDWIRYRTGNLDRHSI